MTTKAEKQRRQNEARVGLASNVVGTTAGLAALGATIRNPALRKPGPENAGPITRRLGGYLKTEGGRARLYRAGAAGALGLQAANSVGDFISNKVLMREAKLDKLKERVMPKQPAAKALYATNDAYVSSGRGSGHGMDVSKRYYDAEADRQRRLGLYAGLGGGTAIVLGDAARRQVTAGKVTEGGRKGVRLALKGKARTPLLLGGGAALSAIAGGAAYKRGISERNRPWS